MNTLFRTYCTLLIFSLLCSGLSAQTLFSTQAVALGINRHATYAYKPDSSEMSICVVDKNSIMGMRYDAKLSFRNKVRIKRPEAMDKLHILLGGIAHDNVYTYYMVDNYFGQIYAVTFDFATGKGAIETIEIDMKGTYMESLMMNEKLYVICLLEKTSKFEVYEFGGKTTFTKKSFDFGEHFTGKKNLDEQLTVPAEFFHAFDVVKIPTNYPVDFQTTHRLHKLYAFNGSIYLTLDGKDFDTKVLTMNFAAGKAEYLALPHPTVDTPEGNEDATRSYTNSFLYAYDVFAGDKFEGLALAQVHASRADIAVSSYDFAQKTTWNHRINAATKMNISLWQVERDSVSPLGDFNALIREAIHSTIAISIGYQDGIRTIKIGSFRYIIPRNGWEPEEGPFATYMLSSLTPDVFEWRSAPMRYSFYVYEQDKVQVTAPTDAKTYSGNVFLGYEAMRQDVSRNRWHDSGMLFRYKGDYMYGYYDGWMYVFRKYSR